MIVHDNSENGPVMRAAKRAMETGNANYILIWLPKESENTLKNLLEKTCCENRTRKNMQNHAIDWYFESVNRLHYRYGGPHCIDMKTGGSDAKTIVLMAERAFETGNFEKIKSVTPITYAEDVRQLFHNIMILRNDSVDDLVAGRAYASAFIAFIAYLKNLSSDNLRESGTVPQ